MSGNVYEQMFDIGSSRHDGRSYTLSGTPANASTRGIVIRNDKKIISSK
jgi:hypothetical protein